MNKWYIGLLIGSCLLIGLTCQAADSFKGRVYPSEKITWVAPESGCKVTQLTTDKADDSRLYLYNDGYVPQENSLVFASRRTGYWNLFYMNIDSGQFVQLTDGTKIKATGASVSPTKLEVYYFDNHTLKAVHLKTLQERTLYTLPKNATPSTLSINQAGTIVAFSIQIEAAADAATRPERLAQKFVQKPECALILVKTDGSGSREVYRDNVFISHTLINPLDPERILYCHEGPWNKVPQRMWVINSDGTQNRALRPEENPAVEIGHEYWFADGIHVGYNGKINGKRFIGVADAQTGEFHEYPGPNDTHTQVDRSGKWFVGDGTKESPYITLYHIQDNRLEGRKLYRHDGSFEEEYHHPHPSFTPDGRHLVFSSNRGGDGNVYWLDINPSLLTQ